VEAVFPEYAAHFQSNVTDARQRAVLLAEDSDYFRAQVKRYLESDGYQVIDAPDGEAAWEMLMENAEAVDAVVTDIEMPRLSGLGLTQRIRADGRFANLPIVGLTSLASEDDIARGKAAGISDYQIKLDRDRLLEALHGYLGAIRKTINQTTDTEITISC
jgi:two-component system chemotaxis sensor kinase CheA